jgi:hypothetical protein
MKKNKLTFLGILFSTIGIIVFFMVSNSRNIGIILMILGFLFSLTNLVNRVKKSGNRRIQKS